MRVRLDTLLVSRGLTESREKAKRLILAGAVRVESQLAHKPSDLVAEDAGLAVAAAEKYASRGGYKLEAALDAFHIACASLVCADLAALRIACYSAARRACTLLMSAKANSIGSCARTPEWSFTTT